ncbi:MAG: amidase [Pseudomonadota bacterium]
MNSSVNELTNLSATEARARIGRGELSPVALLEACIQQYKSVNPVVNAIVTTAFERAREEAQAAEDAVKQALANGGALGALHGLPIAIKDNQTTAGIKTTNGSPLMKDNVPTKDAGVVARIRAAGGIVIGKTNVPEFSIGANTVNPLFGATGNPFNPSLTCGGSSGGSAVAVATNMVPLATGSDHGGSLRIPASYCGVVGYRASPGVVPNEERTTAQTYYSLQGALGRDVQDTALLISLIAARSNATRRDPMAFPLDASQFANLAQVNNGDLKVAITADLGGVMVSDQNRKLFGERVERFRGLFKQCDWHGVNLSEAPGIDWHLRQDIFVSQYHGQAAKWPQDFNPNVKATYDTALRTPMKDIAIARRRQIELYRRFTALFDDYDLLILPGMSVPPFPWADLYPQLIDGKPVENYMAWLGLTSSLTVIGHPVVALPCGLDEQGTPFGIQIVGPIYEDHKLLSAAAAIERAFAQDDVLRRPVPTIAAS